MRIKTLRFGLLLIMIFFSGCSSSASLDIPQQIGRLFPSFVEPTRTPFQPIQPTPTPTLTPTLTPEPVRELIVWLDPALPPTLVDQLQLPAKIIKSQDEALSNLQIGAIRGSQDERTTWVYVLAAAFPVLTDGTSLEEIQRAWRGEDGADFSGTLIMAPQTRTAFEARWGPSNARRVEEISTGDLLDAAWARRSDWAILPFEDLEPRWKMLRIDGVSPVDREFKLQDYPLTVWFGLTGKAEAMGLLAKQQAAGAQLFPGGNWDPQRLTTLVMSGVTALTRATGYKMDTLGTTYPGQDVRDWFTSADLAHISNEVSFNQDCPKANYADTGTLFCSRPEYIELLDYLGTDIIELTGNHNNDWGRAAGAYTLGLYRDRNWSYFGGGANIEEAQSPLKIDHNGNRLAFIGCNPVGPTAAWATADQPGAAPCKDYAWMLDEIRQLRDEGYLPIVTFQYYESYITRPSAPQERDFKAAVDAGAVIISGSQAHFPQTFEFYHEQFIHYGLGNLFFDQMDDPVVGTRREFVDRHIFYHGRHVQTELLTAMLEDYARPRPMNAAERREFLSELFAAAGW